MQVKATELRKGMVLEKDNDLILITDYSHATPGNWRAIIQVKTKSLTSGQVGNFRPAAGDMFETAFLDKKKAQYLYKAANDDFIFMDDETYEQFTIVADLGADKMPYVRESDVIDVTFHGTTPIGIELPTNVTLEVVEAEMAVKGNTATNVKKDAVLVVNTDTGDFVGRAKD